MNLDRLKLVKEDEDSFHIHDGKETFRVAKKGLGSQMLSQITQHFAEGGEVQDPLNFDPLATPEPAPGPYAEPVSEAPASDDYANAYDAAGNTSYTPATTEKLGISEPVDVYGGQSEVASPGAAPVAAATPVVPPSEMKIPGGIPGAEGEVAKAYKQQESAVKARADAAAKQAHAELVLQNDFNTKRDLVSKQTQEEHAMRQARADQMFQDVASSKIDASQFWSSRSTGQKMTATIGMILGGIGSAIGGGPNHAVNIVQGAIERDIDSQKAELGKKQNLLSHYMQQTRDIDEAKRLAMADMKDAFAGKLQAASLQFGNEKAQAAAQKEIGELRASAVSVRAQVASTNMDLRMKGLNMEMTKQALQAQAALTSAMQHGGLTMEMMNKLGPEHPLRKTLVTDVEDSAVTNKDGKPVVNSETGKPLMRRQQVPRFAIDEDAAKKVRPELANNAETMDKVKQLQEFVKGHPHGSWGSKDNQTARNLASDIKLSWLKAQEGVGRLNENELDMLNGMISDPGGWFGAVSGRNKQSAENLMKSVVSKREALKNAFLMPK